MNTQLKLASGLMCSLILTACPASPPKEPANHDVGHTAPSGAPMDHSQHASLEAAEPTDQSLYQLESKWQTQTGKTISLGELGGKPQVLAMVYASCKNACPRIIADMKRIQADSAKLSPNGIRLVLVSIDPEVDTPERLAELARKSQLGDQWLLLRGGSDEVMELAALLGVKYRKISAQDYAHTNMITVLNAKGEIVHRQQGLGVDPAQTLSALASLRPPG